ncbi:MAG: hypothetical protein ACRDNM_16880, partial [Gaiellaceae bacterium]
TDGSIAIVALSHDSVSGYAGTIAGSTVGGGGTVVVDYLANTTTADATSSTLGAAGNGSGVTVEQWATDDSGTESSDVVHGLAIVADETATFDNVAAMIAATQTAGIGLNVISTDVADNTQAYIDASAVNLATSTLGAVVLRAHDSDYVPEYGGALAVGLTGGGLGIGVNLTNFANTTSAYITDSDPPGLTGTCQLPLLSGGAENPVCARGPPYDTDPTHRTTVYAPAGIEITAINREDAESYTVGAGFGEYAGLAGSGGSVESDSTTQAYANEADLLSGAGIDIDADARVTVDYFAGAFAGGIAGGGGSAAKVVFGETTDAYMTATYSASALDTDVTATNVENEKIIAA